MMTTRYEEIPSSRASSIPVDVSAATSDQLGEKNLGDVFVFPFSRLEF